MASGIITPSYKSGFYSPKRGGVAKHPELWRGCIGAWCPALGATGSRLFDQSLYGNHGTLTNMDAAVDWQVTDSYFGLSFTGGTGYPTGSAVVCPFSYKPEQLTVSVFAKSISGSSGSVVEIRDAGNDDGFVIPQSSSFLRVGGAWRNLGSLTQTGYFHSCITYDGTAAKGYKNGIQIASVAASTINWPATASLLIGNAISGGNIEHNGWVYAVSLHRRAMPAWEVAATYRLGPLAPYQLDTTRTLKTTAAAFKAYWSRRQSHIIGGGVS